jgi:hypothetical protein
MLDYDFNEHLGCRYASRPRLLELPSSAICQGNDGDLINGSGAHRFPLLGRLYDGFGCWAILPWYESGFAGLRFADGGFHIKLRR